MPSRRTLVVGTTLPLAALVAVACSTTEPLALFGPPALDVAEAGAPDATWGVTDCATCVRDRCRAEVTRCRSEPTCARRLDCIDACPSSAEAEPDPGCVAACPAASGSAAERAATDVEQCRIGGAGVECEACTSRSIGHRSPLLNQRCDSPSWDAGPDATAVRESCQKCGAERCCQSRQKCNADPTCYELLDCYGACSDPSCIDDCYAKYDASVANMNEAISCSLILCTKECGATPGPCEACFYARCGDEVIACAADHDCVLLNQCLMHCQDDDCHLACRAKFPAAAVALADARLDCAVSRCPECR